MGPLEWAMIRVFLALLLSFVAHEGGHLLAGHFVGFRFGALAVGPACVVRAGGRLRLRWLPPSHWGPFALAYPVTTERIRTRVAWYVAGGPLASLVIAAVALLVAASTKTSSLHSFAAALALASACVFVATAQPFGTGAGVASDGRALWRLLRNDRAADATAALFVLEGLTETGVRPRDWDTALVKLAGKVSAPPAHVLASATAMLRLAEDRNDLAAGLYQVERIRSVYPRTSRWLRADAAIEAAFWLAYFQKDAAGARAFLSDAGSPLVAPHRRLRAEAAVLLAEGHWPSASEAVDRALRAIEQDFSNASPLDLELLQSLDRDLAIAREA